MDYSKIEKEIIELNNPDAYKNMPITRKFGLKRIDMLMKLEEIKRLDAVEVVLVRISNYLRGN